MTTLDDAAAESPDAGGGPGRLSFLDAAERVLRDLGGREPLHYRKITQRARERALIRTEGRTPALTMYGAVHKDIRRRENRGEAPRFVRSRGGLIGLAAEVPVGLEARIEKQNAAVRDSLLQRVRAAPPEALENLVGELLLAMGFEDPEVTQRSKDGGVDVRATLVVWGTVRLRVAVQAKRWGKKVATKDVREFRGSLDEGGQEQGLFITTSDFNSYAKKTAADPKKKPVALMNGEQFAALLMKHEIGVRRDTRDLFTLEEAESEE